METIKREGDYIVKCLVTGGAGFIGSHIVDALIEQKYDVIVIDNESAESNEMFYYNPKAKYYKYDIINYEATRLLYEGVDYVFHLAAESRIQPTLINPTLAFKTNIMGTQTVLQCSYEARVKRVIYSSTSSSYGEKNIPPFVEDMQADCLTPYAVSKVTGEHMCQLYSQLYNLPTIVLRYFNVYGHREPSKGIYAPVVGKFLHQQKNKEPLTIVGDGLQIRDFTHINDVVNANILCMKEDSSLNGEIFNIGGAKPISILSLASLISENHIFTPKREKESMYSAGNYNKAKKMLGWTPQHALDNYISESLKKHGE